MSHVAVRTNVGGPDLQADVLLSVRGLKKFFPIREGVLQRVTGQVRAVDDVTFDIPRGQTVGLVGESGCGKSTLGRCISGLIEPTAGGVYFGAPDDVRADLDELLGMDVQARNEDQRARLDEINRNHLVHQMTDRAHEIYRRNCQLVFQNAFASLNPRHLVKDIVGRPIVVHGLASRSEVGDRVVQLLEDVGLGSEHMYRYPHQFSGGQRQRISIARALALDPEFIVLDEPTSALDVSVQAQILNLLQRLQAERGLTYLFISHDLNVVRHMSNRIVVMYLGEVFETGVGEDVFNDPRHPYTEALLDANPRLDEESGSTIRLEGAVPSPSNPPHGCKFHTRCPRVTRICGWEIQDVLDRLADEESAVTPPEAVEMASPFEGQLVFEDSSRAQEAAALLTTDPESEELRRALIHIRADGNSLHLSFRDVDRVRLEEVTPDHLTSCVLHTRRQEELEEA